jgi:hypothetical protein
MRLIKRWRLQKACVALILFGAIVITINPAADAAGVMKERLIF